MSKLIYEAIVRHSPHSPVLVFSPTRRQARLSAVDLLTHAAADGQPSRFLHADRDDIKPFLDRMVDKVSIIVTKIYHCIVGCHWYVY